MICGIADKFLDSVFCRCHWFRFYVIFTENYRDFSWNLLGWVIKVFESSQRVSTHERLEIIGVRFGKLEVQEKLSLKLAELVLFANCWSVKKFLVCLGCRRAVFSSALRLTRGAGFHLLAWRPSRGAADDFILNSCQRVLPVVRSRVTRSLILRVACILTRVILGAVVPRSLVCTKCVPRYFRWIRSGSELAGLEEKKFKLR